MNLSPPTVSSTIYQLINFDHTSIRFRSRTEQNMPSRWKTEIDEFEKKQNNEHTADWVVEFFLHIFFFATFE